jgi:hypothetical protein
MSSSSPLVLMTKGSSLSPMMPLSTMQPSRLLEGSMISSWFLRVTVPLHYSSPLQDQRVLSTDHLQQPRLPLSLIILNHTHWPTTLTSQIIKLTDLNINRFKSSHRRQQGIVSIFKYSSQCPMECTCKSSWFSIKLTVDSNLWISLSTPNSRSMEENKFSIGHNH